MGIRFILVTLLKNMAKAFIAKPMLLYGARWSYGLSETKLDDTGFEAIYAAYEGDLERAQIEGEKFLEAVKKEIINKNKAP